MANERDERLKRLADEMREGAAPAAVPLSFADQWRYTSPRVEFIRFRPGDRLVVFLEHNPTPAMCDDILKHVAAWAGDVPILVLPKGMTLGVLSADMPTPDVPVIRPPGGAS